MSVEEIYSYYVTEDVEDEELLKYWSEISDSARELSFVQKSEWFNACQKSDIGVRHNVCFIVLLCHGKAKAIYPVRYVQLPRYGLNLNAWQILSPKELGLNDLVFDIDVAGQGVLEKLIKYLNNDHPLPWDMLELKHCRQGGAVDSAVLQNRPSRSVTVSDNTSDYLICESEDNNSVAKLSSKFRRNIRRLRKKLQDHGEITFHMYRESEQLGKAFEEFIEVESSGWKDCCRTSLLQDKKLQSFYRKMLFAFGEDKSCVIHTMKLNGRAIASQFSVVTGDTYNMLKIGYDEQYKLMGPGAVLLDETVRVFSLDEAINKISFVTGGGWQRKWSPESLYVANHYIYNGTIKGNFFYLLEKGKDYIRWLKHYINSKRQ